MQFVIPTKRVAIVRCKGPQLGRRRVLNPLISRPRSLVDPVPLLPNPKVEIAIEAPIAVGLFANLKSRVCAFRPQLIRRSHFKISGDQGFASHARLFSTVVHVPGLTGISLQKILARSPLPFVSWKILSSTDQIVENTTVNGRIITGKLRISMPKRKSRSEKRRRRSIIAFEMIRLDRRATEPLHKQLYRQIRDELKSGRFSDGSSRLPSSRALATERGVSRS